MSEVRGRTIVLRPLADSDAERINAWHNDPELYATLLGEMYGPTLEETRTWLAARIARHGADELNFAVCLREGGEHVGNLYLRDLDRAAGTAEFHGVFLGDARHRGRGLGGDAIDTAMRYALGPLGLREIWGVLLADNLPSLRAMQAAGFRLDERAQPQQMKDGRSREVLRLTLTAPDEGPS